MSAADGGCLGGLPGFLFGVAPVAGLGGGNSASVRSCAGVEALLSSEDESLDCSGVPYSGALSFSFEDERLESIGEGGGGDGGLLSSSGKSASIGIMISSSSSREGWNIWLLVGRFVPRGVTMRERFGRVVYA